MRLRLFSLQLLHSVISKQTQLMKISKNHKLSLEPARQFSAASSSKSLKLLLDGDGTVEVSKIFLVFQLKCINLFSIKKLTLL